MTSQELQVAIENPKSFKIAQLSKERTHLITLYLFGRCYPVSGGSWRSRLYRSRLHYGGSKHTRQIGFTLPHRQRCTTKNLACNYIELI